MRTKVSGKRAAPHDLITDAKKDPTPGYHSASQQSVEANFMRYPKNADSLLKDQYTTDKLSANFHLSVPSSSAQLSFVASHMNVKFSDSANVIPAHSRPAVKTEQGQFKFTVTNISDLDFAHSPSHIISNLPWELYVTSTGKDDDRYLAIGISCNRPSSSILWSCDADIRLKLLSNDSKRKPFVRSKSHKFVYENIATSCSKFILWSKVIDPKNGYLVNDKVTIEAEVTIKRIFGFREFSEFDFVSDAPDSKSDVILIVDGQRIRVCKQYLSMYSPVFHAMFFSKFIERDKKEIVLEDIVPDEFLEWLHVIYPTHKPVTKDNVEFLLKLGDRFNVQFVIEQCERFLLSTAEVSTPKKFIYADQYRLSRLQDVCLKTINGLADVQELEKHAEYKQFTNDTNAAILKRLLEIKV